MGHTLRSSIPEQQGVSGNLQDGHLRVFPKVEVAWQGAQIGLAWIYSSTALLPASSVHFQFFMLYPGKSAILCYLPNA